MTMQVPGLDLATISTPATADQWNTAELAVANIQGLPTTAWEQGGIERTMFAVFATMMAQADVGASIAILAGFLDFAASGVVVYTDMAGATQTAYVTPDPSIPAQNPKGTAGWLDVLAESKYNVQRIWKTKAGGTLALLNTSVSTYGPFAAGAYHVAQPGLAAKPTYSNTASLSIPPSAVLGTVTGTSSSGGAVKLTTAGTWTVGQIVYVTGVAGTTEANGAWSVSATDGTTYIVLTGSAWSHAWTSGGTVYAPTTAAFTADTAGTGSDAASGNLVTTSVTSLIGVSVANVGAWLGSDTESNIALANRCRLKLASISVGGPSGAYLFFALSAQTYAPLLNPPLANRPSTAITRAVSALDKTTGTVTTTIANATGGATGLAYPQPGTPPPDDGSDVYAVGAVIQAYAVPFGTTSIVQGASDVNVTVAITVWVPLAKVAAATPIIQTATQAYFKTVPIGGVTDPGGATNVLPYQGWLDSVANALISNSITPQDMTGTLNGSAANVSLTSTQVAVLANPAFTPTVTGV